MIEGDKPAKDLFDNFAFELAVRFRSMTQKGMVQMFQTFYDKVQGAGMDLFHPDAKPMSKADAVRDVFNVELNKANDHEQKNENDVGNDTGDGETGRSGSSANDRSGGETSQGNGDAESDGGTADGRTEVEGSQDDGKNKHNSNQLKPIGKGFFGDIYNQFAGRIKESFDFLVKNRSGDLLGVFHRNEVGDIDLIWGDNSAGIAHIINKHIGDGKSFSNMDEFVEVVTDVIHNGEIGFKNGDKVVFRKGNYLVTVRKNIREKGKK